MKVAVIAPVLGRPQNALPLVESLLSSTDRARLVFVHSPGKIEREYNDCLALGAELLITDWEPGQGDYARKIQAGYEWSDEPLVLLAADDLRFRPGWFEAVERIADEYDIGVIGTNDNANPTVKAGRHSTHPVVRRCYIDQYGGSVGEPGHVYHQGYDHQWVDCELVETAKARGCYAHAHDAVIQHVHPLYDRKVATDATYAKGQAKGREDRLLFESRRHLWQSEIRV